MNSAQIALPDSLNQSLSSLKSWVAAFTLSNTTEPLKNYTVIVKDTEVLDTSNDVLEVSDEKINFKGVCVFESVVKNVDNLKVKYGYKEFNIGKGEVGFALFETISTPTDAKGYAILVAKQVIKPNGNYETHLECVESFLCPQHNLCKSVNPDFVDILELSNFLLIEPLNLLNRKDLFIACLDQILNNPDFKSLWNVSGKGTKHGQLTFGFFKGHVCIYFDNSGDKVEINHILIKSAPNCATNLSEIITTQEIKELLQKSFFESLDGYL